MSINIVDTCLVRTNIKTKRDNQNNSTDDVQSSIIYNPMTDKHTQLKQTHTY